MKNLTPKILGQPHDEVLLTTDKEYKHFKTYEGRKILTDGLVFRKNYGETGSVTYYQFVIPKKLVNEILRRVHGEFGKHPGITKTIIANREKYFFPQMAQLNRECVMPIEQCIKKPRIDRSLNRPPPPAKPVAMKIL